MDIVLFMNWLKPTYELKSNLNYEQMTVFQIIIILVSEEKLACIVLYYIISDLLPQGALLCSDWLMADG